MSDDYTPSTAEMKEAHDGVEPYCDRGAEWDRWLAAHDESVRAEERDRIARNIEAEGDLVASSDRARGYYTAARIAREGA